jgi:hypothetical protein
MCVAIEEDVHTILVHEGLIRLMCIMFMSQDTAEL